MNSSRVSPSPHENTEKRKNSKLPRFIPGITEKVYWKDLPEDDPDSPPKVKREDYLHFEGYEDVEYDKEKLVTALPSSDSVGDGENTPSLTRFVDDSDLSRVDVKDAMANMIASHCCYGNKVVKEMEIHSIKPTTSIHYTLETFCETRKISRQYVPYKGQSVDGPDNGVAPLPWSIECRPTSLFKDHKMTIEVPHTDYIQVCHRCSARGYLRCQDCNGRGKKWCVHCGGDGSLSVSKGVKYKRCNICHGNGWTICKTCRDDGRITCPVCNGYRQLLHYIALTVIYKTHQDDYIYEQTDMPDDLLLSVTGVIVFHQVLPRVSPITNYPVQEVNENSESIIKQHDAKFSTSEKIIRQRQILRGVPVTEVVYDWKGVRRRCWVFGKERQVYAPDYPQQCCWGCLIQ